MNFKQKLEKKLKQCGLNKEEIQAVIEIAFNDPTFFPTMRDIWLDNAENYPMAITHTHFEGIKPIVYKWICQNRPKAFYRSRFEPVPPFHHHQPTAIENIATQVKIEGSIKDE